MSIRDVAFGYDDRPILNGVSLDFQPGTVTALMGGSGCGKTTLLRLISGQVKAQQGSVTFEAGKLAG